MRTRAGDEMFVLQQRRPAPGCCSGEPCVPAASWLRLKSPGESFSPGGGQWEGAHPIPNAEPLDTLGGVRPAKKPPNKSPVQSRC